MIAFGKNIFAIWSFYECLPYANVFYISCNTFTSIKSSNLKGLLKARIIPAKKFSPISFNAKPITKVNKPATASIDLRINLTICEEKLAVIWLGGCLARHNFILRCIKLEMTKLTTRKSKVDIILFEVVCEIIVELHFPSVMFYSSVH